MTQNIDQIAAKSLGDSTSYAVYTTEYDVSLLNAMPRNTTRAEQSYVASEFGVDVWHCYEATFLNPQGRPVSGILKIVYDSNSPYMVESKSIKLFLNSFDMCKLQSSDEYVDIIKSELSKLLETDVKVAFSTHVSFPDVLRDIGVNLDDIEISDEPFVYDGDYQLTKKVKSDGDLSTFVCRSLRSRCRHTKQKDTGTVVIETFGDVTVDQEELLRLIVSLREKNEFHEFCADMLYTELTQFLGEGVEVSVSMFYTRRGSLDINPLRMTSGFTSSVFVTDYSNPDLCVRIASNQ